MVAVAEEAARVLAQCKEPWVREAIEESFIDDDVKGIAGVGGWYP